MDGPESLPLETAEQIILRWDSMVSEEAREKTIFQCDRQEVDRYLQAVDQIQRSMYSDNLNKIAMARLELEFRNILISHSNTIQPHSLTQEEPQEQEVAFVSVACSFFRKRRSTGGSAASTATDHSIRSIREIDIPSDAVYDLRCIAERMISSGYLRECLEVYGSVRKPAVDASLRRLGINNLSIADVKRLKWYQLDAKIKIWIRAAKVCVRTLFASEKKLCQQIFDGVGTDIDVACFMETVKAAATQLFNFAEGIGLIRRSPEKLFKILDLHEALIDLIPDIHVVFHSKSSESIRVQVVEILSRLAEAARGICSEFENAVLREPSKVPVPGGTIHPMTRYVMNYITFLSDYKHTLNELIVSKPLKEARYSGDPSTPDMDFVELEGKAPLAIHLIWVIVVLQFNLDGKSKHYKDESLSHLFMMNNVHYMVQKVRVSPELREMIGDDYLKKLNGKFQHAAISYQRATWVRVLYCLRYEGLYVSGGSSFEALQSALTERFKDFNAMFMEVHRTQAMWLIPDSQLREELRISISERLIPAYRSFLRLAWSHIERGRLPENYIKYSVEDLEVAVLDIFEGIPVFEHLTRRSQWNKCVSKLGHIL